MAGIGEATRAALLADAGVAALVNARIFPLKLPQGVTYPAVRYQVISEPPINGLRGPNPTRHARVQVDAYAKGYADADALASAIAGALGSREGTTLGSLRLSRSDSYEQATEVYAVSQDFSIWIGG